MGLKGAALVAAVASTVFGSTAAGAQTGVLAVCGDAKGKSYSVNPRRGWDNQRLQGATITFTRDRAGRPDVVLREDGEATSARAAKATLRITHNSRDFSYFIVTASYQHARVDTYQVTFGPDGVGRLLWHSVVSHAPPQDRTDGSLLVASCRR